MKTSQPSGAKAKAKFIYVGSVSGYKLGTRAEKLNTSFKVNSWVRVGSPHYRQIMAQARAIHASVTPSAKPPGTFKSSVAYGYTNPATWKQSQPGGPGGVSKGWHTLMKGSGGAGGAGSGGAGKAGGSGSGGSDKAGGVSKLGKGLGTGQIGQMIPTSDAAAQANAEYGPAIAALGQQITQANAQNAQDLADIGHWYDAAQQQNAQAASSGAANAQAGAQADQGITASLLASMGGAANQGSGAVAAQGAGNAALQNALGTIDTQYGANMAPQLTQEAAGSTAAQQALNSQAIAGLNEQMTSAKQQKAAAQQNALMQIIEANNQLAQQRYSNQLARISTMGGLQELGGNMQLQQVEIAGQKQANQAQAVANQQANALGQQEANWAGLSPQYQDQIAQQLFGMPGVNGSTAAAEQYGAQQGYGGPTFDTFLQDFQQN